MFLFVVSIVNCDNNKKSNGKIPSNANKEKKNMCAFVNENQLSFILFAQTIHSHIKIVYCITYVYIVYVCILLLQLLFVPEFQPS